MRFHHRTPANGAKRTMAYLIDVLPIQAALYVACYFWFGVSPVVDPFSPAAEYQAAVWSQAIISWGTMGVWMLYCIVAEASPWGGTLGKRLMGIRVRSARGGRPGFGQVVGRNFAKILSHVPCSIGFFVAFVSHSNQAWHDMLAGTVVTERR
jgi:uncharacterized RDD family membrane protein YckC